MSDATTPSTTADGESSSTSSSSSTPAEQVVAHPLEHVWVLWYDQRMEPNKRVRGEKREYENNLRAIGEMATVELFWSYFNHVVPPSRMEVNANFHFFKQGIKPMWEDAANASGGKWIVVLKAKHRGEMDRMWSNLLLGLIGETLDIDDEVCGAVCSRRRSGDKIAVWTRNKHKEDVIMKIGHNLRRLLELPSDLSLNYQVHEDALKSASSYNNKNRYVC